MFAKIKSLAKQSAVYGLGTIVTRVIAFLLLPYYSHLMSTTEFGIYSLFMVLVTVIQPVYVHGIDIAFLRYAADEESSTQNRLLGTALLQTLFVGGILSALMLLFSPLVAKIVVSGGGSNGNLLTKISAGFILIDTLSNQIFTHLRIKRRPLTFSTIKLGHVILNIALNIYLVGTLRLGAVGAFYAFLYTSAVTLFVLLIVVIKDLRFSYRRSEIIEWLKFGLPNLPAQLFVVAVEFSDRKWIEALMNVSQAGIYSAGYRVGMLMNMVAQAFRYAWQPFFMQHAKDSDARETFARVLTYYIIFAAWIWIFSALLLEYVLKMPLPKVGSLIHPDYWEGFKVFPVIMLAHIFNGIYANFMAGVYLKNKTKAIPLIVGIAAVVNIAGNFFLIPIYGYMASAWLTVVSYGIMTVLMYLYINPKYPVPYEWDRIIRTVISTAAFYGVTMVIMDKLSPNTGELIRIAIKLGIVTALPIVWWQYILLPEERDGFRRRLKR